MQETIAKEVLVLLKNNHDIMIYAIIIFGILSAITLVALAILFIKFKVGLNLIERYHAIFDLNQVEEYVSIVQKKDNLKREDYEARLQKIMNDNKDLDNFKMTVTKQFGQFYDEIIKAILFLVVAIPIKFREELINSAFEDKKTPATQHIFTLLKEKKDLLNFQIIDIQDGEEETFHSTEKTYSE